MIAAPLNDHECLEKLAEVARRGSARHDVRQIAHRFATTRELAQWIRTLPQRNDTGETGDGPRVRCDVSQRARLPADDPNCVERSILYLSAAELLDPRPKRALATIDTPLGRHTFPVEDGEPVVLDPSVPRNALRAGLYLLSEPHGPLPDARPAELLSWLADLAEEPARELHGQAGVTRVRRARRSLSWLLEGRGLSPDAQRDVQYLLDAAAREAPLFGRHGIGGVRWARRALAKLGDPCTPAPRNVGLPRKDARPAPLGTLEALAPRNASLSQLGQRVGEAARRVSWERVATAGGKVVASSVGLGALYDPALTELKGKAKTPASSLPTPPRPASRAEVSEAASAFGTLDVLTSRR